MSLRLGRYKNHTQLGERLSERSDLQVDIESHVHYTLKVLTWNVTELIGHCYIDMVVNHMLFHILKFLTKTITGRIYLDQHFWLLIFEEP